MLRKHAKSFAHQANVAGTYHKTSSINPQTYMFLVASCSCLCPIRWSQVLSWERRCCWSSADRRWSNYIWVINNYIAHKGATYIRGFTVSVHTRQRHWSIYRTSQKRHGTYVGCTILCRGKIELSSTIVINGPFVLNTITLNNCWLEHVAVIVK